MILKLITELNTIRQKHRPNLLLCRQRQHLKGIAGMVLTAVRDRLTDAVTGHDMAHFIMAL